MQIRNTTQRRYILKLPTGKTRTTQNGAEVPEIKTVILSTAQDKRQKGDPLLDKGVPANAYPLSKDELAYVKKNPGLMALIEEHRQLELVA